jgi:hypothetical protein
MTNPNPAAPLTEAEPPGLAAMLTEIVALCDLPVEDMRRLYGSEERVLMAVIPARISAVLDKLTEDRWASGVSIAAEALARATSTPAGLREALVRRLIAEYDEDNRRSPSFVTIGLLREAVGED